MRAPTKKQLSLVEQLDRGVSIEEIAAGDGRTVSTVKKRLARVRRRVLDGQFSPAPLPIEKVARSARIYLAGFDVFRLDAVAHGEHLKVLCRERGFVGIYPLDASVPPALAPNEKAKWIYTANVDAIRSADAVMANLNDFRGPGEPDSGTAFEVGFATALGKPVWGYRASAASLIDHVPSTSHRQGAVCDGGFLVEDFEMGINLMLGCASTLVVGGPQECLDLMRASGAFD